MPKKSQPKTNAQNKSLWGLAARRGFTKEDLRDLAEVEFGSRSISKLDFDQTNFLIRKLGGNPHPAFINTAPPAKKNVSHDGDYLTAEQDYLLKELRRGRRMTDDGYAAFCTRILRGKTAPSTVKEGQKVIEAIKAMNKRDVDYPKSTIKQEAA